MKRSASLIWGNASKEPDVSLGFSDEELVNPYAVDEDNYAHVLADDDSSISEHDRLAAWHSLEEDMAFVIAGSTSMLINSVSAFSGAEHEPEIEEVAVSAMYVDRFAVTNADYHRFVEAGGYRRPEFWPDDVLHYLPRFVDSTGEPGPRYWRNGRPPGKKANHPVVGINWYEAYGYARWMGKRLPTPAEWQWAATWSVDDTDPLGLKKYPWGNAFESSRANLWSSGHGDTVPVDAFYDGCTPNGIYQMVGNVWEWVAAVFSCEDERGDMQLLFDQPMAEVRGGAFDTYFDTQSHCCFRTGQPLLNRTQNVGFRCCINAESITPPSDPSLLLKD